ncbi:MAG: hypothetical protein GX147_10595 [Deltaproteobacteria bacterium]|nr:hypothetical protein [Deltaproteobacteria bacterium]
MALLRLLAIALCFYIVYRIYRFMAAPSVKPDLKVLRKKEVKGVDLVEDPVCRTYIPLDNVYKKIFLKDGTPVHFCSRKCYEMYREKMKSEGT